MKKTSIKDRGYLDTLIKRFEAQNSEFSEFDSSKITIEKLQASV
jgi:hypothetical protein